MPAGLTVWRQSVVDWLTSTFDVIGHQPVRVYGWPTLKPETPAIVVLPGAPRGVLVDLDSEIASFCGPGAPEARLMFLLDAQWNAAAFDELDDIASVILAAAPPFHVTRILQPGIVDDIPNRTLIGLGVDIAGLYPI